MPVTIRKLKSGKVRVSTPGGIKSKAASPVKATRPAPTQAERDAVIVTYGGREIQGEVAQGEKKRLPVGRDSV